VVLAHEVQNIIMFPWDQTYSKIIMSNQLANCPVKCSDIITAKQLFGKNINALKGKTVYWSWSPIAGWINGVPPHVQEWYQYTVLGVDIMFVNKIPFLITISRGLHFGTVETLQNQQVLLKLLTTYYAHIGAVVSRSRNAMQIQNLCYSICSMEPAWNLCSQDEHIPEIKWYIQTVKEWTHSGYNSMPFK
jgi:hypothetical protein